MCRNFVDLFFFVFSDFSGLSQDFALSRSGDVQGTHVVYRNARVAVLASRHEQILADLGRIQGPGFLVWFEVFHISWFSIQILGKYDLNIIKMSLK